MLSSGKSRLYSYGNTAEHAKGKALREDSTRQGIYTPFHQRCSRTDLSRQAGSPVSQNQIRKSEQDVQFCGLFLQTSVSCFSKAKLLLYNSKDMFHFRSDGSFFALSALDPCSGSIGAVLALGWTTINFVMNTLAIFVPGYRFRALFGSEIAAVSVDKLLLSGKKFCHHTDIVFVGGCNFQ